METTGYRRTERGQALIEFVLILPIFLFLVLGSLDFLWFVGQRANLDFIAGQAAICNAKAGCNPAVYAAQAASGLHLNPAQLTVTINSPKSVTLTYTASSLTTFTRALTFTATATTP